MYAIDDVQPTTMQVPMMDMPPPPHPADLLTGVHGERDFGGGLGFVPGPSFLPHEVARIGALIKAHMLETAKTVCPGAYAQMAERDLEDYHLIDELNLATMLSKEMRPLPAEAVDEITSMSFFTYVKAAFGDFILADEVDRGYGQITFRLVRPEKIEDVGSLHRDDWFWNNLNITPPADIGRVKVWVPVCSQPELDGLRMAAGSHRLDIPYRIERQNNKLSFVTGLDPAQLQLCQFGGPAGQALFFNYYTLHVGSLNRGTRCRVSIETSILYRLQGR